MFQTDAVKKSKHISCSVTFFEKRVVYEIMCKTDVEPDRPQTTIWHMRITKTTDTHSEYVILIAFPLQSWICVSA